MLWGKVVTGSYLFSIKFYTLKMTDKPIITSDPTLDGGHGAEGEPKGLKEVLEKELGKQFQDEASALKAVKDTFNYVGKAGKFQGAVEAVMRSKGFDENQAIEFIKSSADQKVDPNQYVSKDEFNERTFFAEKPELRPYKDLISAFKTTNPGKSLDEIILLPAVKEMIDKGLAHDKISKQKSVLHSNPKLQVAEDKMSKAHEEKKAGNIEEAKVQAVGAVMEAYNLDQSS